MLAAVLLALTLAGCQSISYEPVKLDSSAPIDLKPCARTLSVDQSCTALVQAERWISPTGIHAEAGETYCVSVPPNQVWFDAGRRNTPPHGEEGNWLMNLALKRHKDYGFFNLIVNTKSLDTGRPGKEQDVSKGAPYKVTMVGELVLYPNDALGPDNDPAFYYKNNAGQVWVTISQCPAPAQ